MKNEVLQIAEEEEAATACSCCTVRRLNEVKESDLRIREGGQHLKRSNPRRGIEDGNAGRHSYGLRERVRDGDAAGEGPVLLRPAQEGPKARQEPSEEGQQSFQERDYLLQGWRKRARSHQIPTGRA